MALGGVSPVITDVVNTGLVPALVAVATVAVAVFAGVFDSLLGSDEEEEEDDFETEEVATSDGGTMFADDTGDEAELDLEEEDPFGGDAFAAEDEQTDDLEPRLEQLEEEVSSLSSTVSTVRTENEQISESVEDVEENVRKLLDIYKMVTKGVNPFVDQQSGGVAANVDEDTLGLFEDDDEPEETSELDDDVMEAEAEEFFDEDFESETTSAGTAEEQTESIDEFEPLDAEGESATAAADTDGARGFDDLKSEYDEESAPADDAAVTEHPTAKEEPQQSDTAQPPQQQPTEDHTAPPAETHSTQPEQSSEPTTETIGADEFTAPSDPKPAAARQPLTADDGRPYLQSLPPGPASDRLVLEWLEFLIDASSPAVTYSAVTHYQRLGWIGESAATHLKQFIAGHPAASPPLSGSSNLSGLTVEHHLQSLKYIARLDGSGTDLWLWGDELTRLDTGRR